MEHAPRWRLFAGKRHERVEGTGTGMAEAQQKGRLGRGLASLIGEQGPAQSRLPPEGVQRVVPIDQIRPGPFNPRKTFREDELDELADSIRQKGLVQPLIVREGRDGKYEIVAGERRWRAAQRAGVHMVAVIIRDLDDQEVLELAIIENVQRTDLNAIEEASGYRDLIERFNYTQDRLAEAIGKSRSHLANTLRLLKLPEAVRAHVSEGRLTAGHARPLVGRDDAEELAELIIAKELSVRDVEALVQRADVQKIEPSTRRAREKDPDTRAFETEVSNILGLKVEIRPGAGETGSLTIRYTDFDQLDYLRMLLVGERR
jgi:ParB family chromosome partitioning protein